MCRPLSWHSCNICDVQNLTFHENVSSLFFYTKALVTNTLANAVRTIFHHYVNGQKIVRTAFVRVFVTKALGMLGLRWMCMHLWTNLIKRTIDIQEKLQIFKIYVQSQCRVVLLWYHRFWQSSIQRGRHTQLCIITSLIKWIIKICSNFYCWVCKIAFYSPNPHCCLGKLPL